MCGRWNGGVMEEEEREEKQRNKKQLTDYMYTINNIVVTKKITSTFHSYSHHTSLTYSVLLCLCTWLRSLGLRPVLHSYDAI